MEVWVASPSASCPTDPRTDGAKANCAGAPLHHDPVEVNRPQERFRAGEEHRRPGSDRQESRKTRIGFGLVLRGGSEPDMAANRFPERGEHLRDVLRSLREEKPVEVRRLADQLPEVLASAVGRLVVENIRQRCTEHATPTAMIGEERLVLTLPPAGQGPIAGAGSHTLAMRSPLDTTIALVHQRLGIAVVARGRDSRAADPRIEGGVSPLDCGNLSHDAPPPSCGEAPRCRPSATRPRSGRAAGA